MLFLHIFITNKICRTSKSHIAFNADFLILFFLIHVFREETSRNNMYCFLVEKCILNCLNDHNEICPLHGSMSPRFMMSQDGIARTLYIAPEILFSDLDTSILIGQADTLTLVKLVGKGAFGEVYQGKLRKVFNLINKSSVFGFD